MQLMLFLYRIALQSTILYVCSDFCQTTGPTNMKLGANDHYPGMNVIKGLVTSQ